MSSRSSKLPLSRSWRGNPLLLREAGLRRGTPIWRSAWTMVMILTLVWGVVKVAFWIYMDSNHGAQYPVWWKRSTQYWLDFIIAYLPVWFCARAWARERHGSMRDELAASPLTLSQLIRAKAMIWLLPLLLAVLISGGREIFIFVMQLTAFAGSRWYNGIDRVPPGIVTLMSVALGMHLLHLLAGAFLKIALVSRLTLRLLNAPVAFILSIGISWSLIEGPQRLYSWWLISRITAGNPPVLPDWVSYSATFGPYALVIIIAIAIWWGLRRHAARVYGMER